MLRCACVLVLPLAACGGGGGGAAATVPNASPVRLTAADAEIGTTATTVDVLVQLASTPTVAPSLLQVAVELPPALTLPATDRLLPATPLVTLDGDFVGNRFVIACGDARNVDGAPLQAGPLFRLRLQATTPRQPGTWTVRFASLRGATNDGQPVAVDTTPAAVDVVVR